jgi:histidinol-phosphatase (PHP family)
MEAVVEIYFDHIEAALDFASGLPVPARLAHPSLVEAFRLISPPYDEAVVKRRLRRLLPRLREGVSVWTPTVRVCAPSTAAKPTRRGGS